MSRPLVPLLFAATLGATLAGCAGPGPDGCDVDPTPAECTLEVEGSTGSGGASDGDGGEAPAPAADGAPVTADGLPDTGVVGCATLLDSSVTSTDFDTQWSFEFECADRSIYDANVATLEAAGYTHSVSQDVGSGSLIWVKDHFITDLGGAFDVDLEVRGDEGEPVEMKLLFTLSTE